MSAVLAKAVPAAGAKARRSHLEQTSRRLAGMERSIRLTALLRVTSYLLAGAGAAVILTLGSDDDRRTAARWMSRGSTLILAAVILSVINVWVSRRKH